MVNIILDLCINYNTLTKDITCCGLKISGISIGPVTLTKHASAVVKLEEQAFIHFDDFKIQVIEFYFSFKFI